MRKKMIEPIAVPFSCLVKRYDHMFLIHRVQYCLAYSAEHVFGDRHWVLPIKYKSKAG